MGNDTLNSAAHAAGFAMATSDDLLTPPTRRAGDAAAPRTPDAPADALRQAAPAKTQLASVFSSLSWPTLPSFWKAA